MRKLDAIVIGSGQGGTPLAKALAQSGLNTVIIEKRWVGGTCVNDGCTPTKTMIADARAAYVVKHSYDHGVDVRSFTIDLPTIIARKNKVVASSRNNTEKGLQQTKGLELLYGTAVFTGQKIISVMKDDGTTETLTADKIFINTGAKPLIPAIPGLAHVSYYDSTSLLDVDKIPTHLVIVGASYIALEMGQLFRRLGSTVSILEKSHRILPKEDEDIAHAVQDMLVSEGITIHTGAAVTELNQLVPEKIQVTLSTNDILEASHILLASGRVPQSAALHPAATGLQVDDKGYILVNEYLETNVPGIYALGDVKPGPAFTHVSYNDYIILRNNLLKHTRQSTQDRPLLYCMFTDPELGRVGLTEQEAQQRQLPFTVVSLPMSKVARGIETGETRGLMKAIVHRETMEILGASILGASGGEVMTVLQMAMAGRIRADQLRDMMFAHPLFSESLNNLFMQLKQA
ncbi:Pyruvate/2-oxoglutarate dehydrogenase complex, dihydrolipoamide dehydrogenase (E3) component [Chitinophaga costaii]|uniref:Pyruvate/2-oxoglutarate dehydrogenase complex, dihydrolipoamide dehydrogenase (E3) component n=1 Tax=Chitinophaga costaii TaxID=1335309 RepID=A0A1C4FNP8_9BACT|nr:mercuric reductase [Chitinophaga costaii]PUZ29908.1 mercuric reductase [Chitinophaga costaii]SCC57512.1 Pyruvate/2-oxoglutarate dehydrogenase complex, dihydrolipoamide dehydrogenase (E3) component [Chitinophaga costaii]